MDYGKIIQKAVRMSHIHHMLIADFHGNVIAKNKGCNEEEGVMCSFLYQSANQIVKELKIAPLKNISFLTNGYKCIVTSKKEVLVLCMADKNVSTVKYDSFLDKLFVTESE